MNQTNMSEETIKIHFVHPTDGREVTVDVDPAMTAAEAISELIAADFVKASPEGYLLAIKGGAELRRDQTFKQAGVVSDSKIRVVPATDAGISAMHILNQIGD